MLFLERRFFAFQKNQQVSSAPDFVVNSYMLYTLAWYPGSPLHAFLVPDGLMGILYLRGSRGGLLGPKKWHLSRA